jgi:rSAM/selenodomain-associated transferase 2
MRLSVIIPAINEAGHIGKAVASAIGAWSHPPPFVPPPAGGGGIGVSGTLEAAVEVIVVDGGSTDGTPKIASGQGAKVISSPPGRATQMNAGAGAASGDVLLFLHADTTLPVNYASHVFNALEPPDVAAGAFMLKLDSQHPVLRAIGRLANWRARWLKLPYGDQAIFLRARSFREIGGFPEMPVMEDFELMRRMRKKGAVTFVPAYAVTSARRWTEKGILRTTLVNQAVIIGYLMGVSRERLAGWR